MLLLKKYGCRISFYSVSFIIMNVLCLITITLSASPSPPAKSLTFSSSSIQILHVSSGSSKNPSLTIKHPFSNHKNKAIAVAVMVKNGQQTPEVRLSNITMHLINNATQQVKLKAKVFRVYWYYLLENELPVVKKQYDVAINHDGHYVNAGVTSLSNVRQMPPESLAKNAATRKDAQTLRTNVKTQHSEIMLLDAVVADKDMDDGQLTADYLQRILWNDGDNKKGKGGQAAISAKRINLAQETPLIWRWKNLNGELNMAATSVVAFKPATPVSPAVDAGEDETLSVWRGPNLVPPAPRPAYLQSFTDPVYKSTITRVTDESQDGYNKNTAMLRHNYPNDPVWNVDMSLIKLNFGQIRDANTHKLVKFISKDEKTGKSYNEILWSSVHPHILYGLNGYSLGRYSLKTGEWTILRTFKGYGKLTTDYMSTLSTDDRYIALNDKKRILIYDLLNDKIAKVMPQGEFTTASMSQSGRYVLLTHNNGFFAYDQQLDSIKKIAEKSNHDAFGYDADGNEVVIQMCPTRMVQIDNGKVTDLLGLSYVCGHVTARNYKKPGWAYVSANIDTNDKHYGPHISGEIIEIKLDDSGVVNTLAHARTTSHDYESHAFVVASPDGSKIIFGSDWGDKDATVYDYVINNKDRPFSQTTLRGHIDAKHFSAETPLQVTWRKVSGKGNVVFADHQAANTHVTFSQQGRYVLQLRVSDGKQQITDEVAITVGTSKFH